MYGDRYTSKVFAYKNERAKRLKDLIPATIALVQFVQGKPLQKLLKVLLDSRSSHTLIHERCISSEMNPTVAPEPLKAVGPDGEFDSSQSVVLKSFKLPEFGNSRSINKVQATIFSSLLCQYNLIFGQDLLAVTGITMDFTQAKAFWTNCSIEFKPYGYLHSTFLFNHLKDKTGFRNKNTNQLLMERLLSNKCIYQMWKNDVFLEILQRHTILFNGKLGCYPHKEILIKLVCDAAPIHLKPFLVPCHNLKVFKNKLDNMVTNGMLTLVSVSE
mmetsp:Transcript_8360/g.11932  ORF Transcript_8360/g.11932 Transcript_8360/m.11932 type:complete len:272 (-) Transcript_8360:1807-2622(-)|eukprot:CAMPEP_0184869780 /NCGR_PEP_ID=MMETSP0580-20130426/35253_1 /TAXON_ID=1118495 /ORGANISM="Dactyliosolen fragilissimus" /LENGTH=271 /DNA_ID=CAMNT_0027371489 /DNA_START=708 /DNA_END=1523 /DNA_ORIENTATION=+